MATSRFPRAAGMGLATCGSLLVAFSFAGCGLHREYVRRGAVMDTVAQRLDRLEQAGQREQAQNSTLRADVLTQLEVVLARLDELDARLSDQGDRLDRISRKLGLGRGTIVAAPETLSQPEGAAPAPSRPGPPDTQPAAPVDTGLPGIDPDKLYNNAYLDFTRGQYDVAISGFRQFLELFPESEMADNALYWVGECHYSLGRLDSAEAVFRSVPAEYPDGNKAPAAAYKLGLVYDALGRPEEARRQLALVVQLYAGTTEARLAQDRLDNQQ